MGGGGGRQGGGKGIQNRNVVDNKERVVGVWPRLGSSGDRKMT